MVHTGLGGTEAKTLVHGRRTRSYRIHTPPSYREGHPMALVFALHGYSGTAASFEKRIGFNRIADREGFIVVYPNAVPWGPKQKQLWNGGGIYEIWWGGQVDDVGFFAKLIDTVSADYTIDPKRIFVFGNSSGGFMAHHLGARLPGRFAAIAPWGSLLAFNDFVAGPPVSVIHFHGGQDKKVLYNGLPNWNFYGVEQGIRLWATRNGCKSAPIIIKDDPNTLVRRWAAQNRAGDVVLYKLKNHGHSMPTPSTCNLPEIAWAFFKNHPRSNVKIQWPESQSPTEPFAVGPYLGQTPPGPIPKVFAPGLICRPGPNHWEAFGTFSADANTFCFQRVRSVFITENTDQGWTAPKRIESIRENHPSAWSACLSPDANSIFYTIGARHPWIKHYDLFRCDRTSQGWAKPQRLGPPLSSPGKENSCSIAANNSIYLNSERKWGQHGRSIIWVAPFVDNTWPRVDYITLDHPRAGDPGIAPDESFMVFYSIRPGAIPGTETDLYLTLRRPDGTWTKPRNMGPRINSSHYEHGPRISPDKKYLFFNRCTGWDSRICAGDIYWVELKEYLPESYRSPEGMVNGHRVSMKRRSVIKQITGIGSIQASAEPIAKGPYLGQTPPGPIAKVFAPELICDTRPHQGEAWLSFSADGNTFCFNRRGYVYITENTDQGWTMPKYIESIPYRTTYCCLSADANSIYFMYSYDPSKRYHPFRCQRTSDEWSDPQELGPTFSYSGAYAGFSLAANNSIYLFRSKPRDGGSGGGIFYAPYVNNIWTRLIKLPIVGTAPGIAPDESFMIFTAIRPRGLGETDLYLTMRRPDGTWTEARNMGPRINSRFFEFGARISPDKKYMFFTRSNGWYENQYRDTSDIYWVELKEYLPESYR